MILQYTNYEKKKGVATSDILRQNVETLPVTVACGRTRTATQPKPPERRYPQIKHVAMKVKTLTFEQSLIRVCFASEIAMDWNDILPKLNVYQIIPNILSRIHEYTRNRAIILSTFCNKLTD